MLTSTVEAQAPATSASLGGIVIDASNGTRLDGVTVTLEPSPQGLVVDPRGLLFTTRTAVTSSDGGYRFAGVPPGRYRIHVQRIGYRTTIFEADVQRPMDARISVGLELEPVALQAMQVEQYAAPTFRRVSGSSLEPETARSALEHYRQDLFLTPDSRALTMADLVEGITFGEGDVFRALQRFPGVATRDDYTAELWTRGAPWAQTRVSFDGLPLFNPVHAVGVFSAVTPDILGAVFFHPGVRSVSLGEGAAGAVELRSRPGDGAGRVDGSLDVSMASAKVTVDQNIDNGRVAWIVSARRSYLDVLTGGLDWLGLHDIDLPYAFHDLSGRIDVQLGTRTALEASGIWEDDRLFGNVEGILERTTARWGNAAARVTLHAPIGQWAVHHTLGFSRYRAHIEQFDTVAERAEPWVEPPSDNRIAHMRFASEFQSPAPRATPPPWAFGYEIVAQDARYDGPEPRFYPVRPDTAVRLIGQGAVWNAGLWAESRLRLGPRVTFAPGLRAEAGTAVLNGGSVRLAPRFAIRFALTPAQTMSVAAGRSWQYLQALAVAGPSAHPAFHAGQFWLWAGADAPALRADVFTLGTERWLGGWLGSATAYYRHASGVALPDPHPGKLAERPLFVVGENRAHGVEVGIRRVAGRWTTALAYTYGVSTIDAAGLTFPATTDRRHRVDATAGIRVPAGFRLGLAYSAMTGSPFTRVHTYSLSDCSLFGFGCGQTGSYIEDPNAQRTLGYRSLDATVQWARTMGHIEIGAYVQVRNVTGRDNATTYSGSTLSRLVRPTTTDSRVLQDRFEKGLPRMPLVGARIAF